MREFGAVTDLVGDRGVISVDSPVLDDFEVLFERDAWWIQDVGAMELELQ